MPYFKSDDINVLLIHIPKTGGTSLESYFSSKFNIPLNNKSVFSGIIDKQLLADISALPLADASTDENMEIISTLQHITYNQFVKYSKIFNIDFDNIKIITIVRNPYERFVSDLFYFRSITINSTKEEVFDILKKYIVSNIYDNHNIPQHKFITNDKGEIIQNIHILKTESLTNGMKSLGYSDFDMFENVNTNKVNYYNYLNNESFEIINNFYHLDFILFNYDKFGKNAQNEKHADIITEIMGVEINKNIY